MKALLLQVFQAMFICFLGLLATLVLLGFRFSPSDLGHVAIWLLVTCLVGVIYGLLFRVFHRSQSEVGHFDLGE